MWTEYQIKKLLSIHKSKALEWAFSPCQEYQFTNTFWSRLYSGQLRMPHSQLIKKISFAISKSNKDVWSDSLRKSVRNRKLIEVIQFSSVQFSHSVLSNSLWPHGLQHARLPCPSPILSELTQTHVHWVSDAIQPSHPLSSLSPYITLHCRLLHYLTLQIWKLKSRVR